ncbi:cell adhesion molecule CEACAM1-like isoform X2 [Antedon mediterranea]|uniref:cell adhesion molecule CEACAM1-like isoform X2 n=1 Tax=Antedon mediterranea TaxID=105859 RepID=UPI003AF5C2E9
MITRNCVLINLFAVATFHVINGQTEPVVNVQDANVKIGEDAVITCSYTLSGSTFNAAQWYNSNSDGDQLDILVNTANTNQNGRYTADTTQTGVTTLTIANTVLSDDGYYLCRIVDLATLSGKNNGNLTVQYLDTPVLKSDTLSVMINDTAKFTCTNLIGKPTSITVRWTQNDVEIDDSDGEKYPSSDSILIINKVDQMDAGSYRCVAENAAYSGEEGKHSNPLELSVGSFDPTDPNDGVNGGLIGGVVSAVSVVLVFIGIFVCQYKKIACFNK